MKVLYIGGSGEISPGCIAAGLELNQQITVFNRGNNNDQLPEGVDVITGDMNDDAAYVALADHAWDVVCQFRVFDADKAERDIKIFNGKCKQYVFISTASAYEKPQRSHLITEETPLVNPHWEYSRKKAACEALLMQTHEAGRLPVTIVRPSHTNRTRFPGTFIDADHMAWRMLQGKPVIVHGDGSSLWTLTRCEDFGNAFARLLGNEKTLGEAYHITSEKPAMWNCIVRAIAAELGVEARIIHVASETLIRYNPAWEGPLLGDKSCSVFFDNTKVKQAVGGWECQYDMPDAIRLSAPHVRKRLETFTPNAETDALIDRIIADQLALGS